MSLITLLAILVSVSLSVAAQILLKYGVGQSEFATLAMAEKFIYSLVNPFIFLGLFCYGLSMVFWLYVLSQAEVSRAYPFVGLGFVGTMLVAHFFLSEPITTQKFIGTLCVVLGVILLAR
ncbi:Small Multi-Drug resistant family protein [Methylophaga lonarensis MPL]|uniref:Small Multi-Drug resistant family protein n=1 Tax=Methylophaga lonarensis MPL TaxID=1286106 RepID=M7NZU6_9GAMM|nr:EamA family transporter [Methylophaga lonarensis]EMR14363.1 Small Multi-Drug resistant family protein [Methylophaga lonarensis MPL]